VSPCGPFRRSLSGILLAVLAALPFLTGTALAQDRERHRLILKDGSYQLATKYEIKGDRVRYLSAEREEWEELPTALVDWPATEKYEKERATGSAAAEALHFDKEIENEDLDTAKLPEVAPSLRLPADNGVFLLDTYQSEPQLLEIQQVQGDVQHTGKGNIFRNPMSAAKQAIELPGEHAAVQAHVDVPAIYIKAELSPEERVQQVIAESGKKDAGTAAQNSQSPAATLDRYRIIRTQPQKGKRILGDVKLAANGRLTQQEHFEKTTNIRVAGGWIKVTPAESLPSGEYALVEMMDKEGMSLDVWDFGVNPKAPANKNPWRPEKRESPKAPAAPEQK
jgi:hypothetical protein